VLAEEPPGAHHRRPVIGPFLPRLSPGLEYGPERGLPIQARSFIRSGKAVKIFRRDGPLQFSHAESKMIRGVGRRNTFS
jgi:hypothetical protein